MNRGLVVWARRVLVMTVKELRQLLRDTVLIGFTVYAFSVDIYNAGSGVSLSLSHATTVVFDQDHSYASRELVSRFREPYFSVQAHMERADEGMRRLDTGSALIALNIDSKFEESLLKGKPTAIQMQLDSANTVTGFLANNYGAQIVGRFGLETAMTRLGASAEDMERLPVIIDDHRVWFNPNQNDGWFMSISELLNVITLFSLMLPAAAMVREKERGTVEQLLVSPLTTFQIMFPKVLSMTLVILALTAMSLFLVLQGVFHVPVKGSLLLFFAITALYVFTTAALGLVMATFARNMAQVGMMIVLIIAPMIFLSGVWTPPEALPPIVRLLMLLSPLHYFVDASYGVLLKGSGLDLLWDSILGMVILGATSSAVAMWRFRRQFG